MGSFGEVLEGRVGQIEEDAEKTKAKAEKTACDLLLMEEKFNGLEFTVEKMKEEWTTTVETMRAQLAAT